MIVLTRNRREDVLEMLCSLEAQTFTDFEVVVVDQASTDGTARAIADRHPRVRLFVLPENIGVPGGRNVGVAEARGDILLFLDDDATVGPRAIEAVLREFETHPDTGIVTGRVDDYYTGTLQRAYWVYPDYWLTKSETRFATFTFSGGVHAVRRDVLTVTGLYDQLIYFGPEEYGLSMRCFAAGWRIVYNPRIVLQHKGRHRLGWDADRWRLFVRGRLYVALSYCPLSWLLVVLLEYLGGHFVQAVRGGMLWAYAGAVASVVRNLTQLLAHRRPLSRRSFRSFRRLERSQRGPVRFRILHELLRTRRVVC